MDMFFAYLLIASATPLFLWLDNKKVAISSIPPIIFFFFYMTSSLSPTGHSLMIALFILNVVIAHVAAFIIYGLPLIRKHMSR